MIRKDKLQQNAGELNTSVSVKDLHYVCRVCDLRIKYNYCNGDRCLPYITSKEKRQIIFNEPMSEYSGVRFTSDAMDCSLPMSIDSHSGCSFGCLYCFSNNLQRAVDRNPSKIESMLLRKNMYGEWPIKQLAKFLNRELNLPMARAMYPLIDTGMPIQLGALGDPLDDLEEVSGWLLKAVPLFVQHKQPVRLSTKGARVMMLKKYRDTFHANPEQFWFAFSIITADDEKLEAVDIAAPNATERLKAMKAYSKAGHPVSLRFRPFLLGISDYHKKAAKGEGWKVLLEKAAEAGAKAISFEFIFLNSALTPRQNVMYKQMFKIQEMPQFGELWNGASNPKESCRRASRSLKFDLTMAIREKTHELGMVFGCSDPHFKEYNDTGSCCGILPDDPWFGKWSRRQLTNVIVEMRKAYEAGKPVRVTYKDWAPEWAHKIVAGDMIAFNNYHARRVNKYMTFGDNMRNKWNNPNHPRGPYIYFAGMMRPVGTDTATGDLVYEYQKWDPHFDKTFKGTVNEMNKKESKL